MFQTSEFYFHGLVSKLGTSIVLLLIEDSVSTGKPMSSRRVAERMPIALINVRVESPAVMAA